MARPAASRRAGGALERRPKPLSLAGCAPMVFGATQQARLRTVFASGVCDGSRPGVGQPPSVGPLAFAAGPDGQPMPPQPLSQPKR